MATHPWSSTHSIMSEEDRIKAGITEVNIANIDHLVLGYNGLIDFFRISSASQLVLKTLKTFCKTCGKHSKLSKLL